MKSVDSRSTAVLSSVSALVRKSLQPVSWRSQLLLAGSLVVGASTLGLFSGAGMGCGNPCDAPDADPALCGNDTASPEPSVGPCADDSFLDSIPTTWALQRHLDQEVFVYGSPATVEGWYPQFTDSIFLLTMTNNGDGTFAVNEDLCGVSVSTIDINRPDGGIAVQATGFPKDPGDWAPSASWTAKFSQSGTSSDACSVSFSLYSELESKEIYSIWGANLSNPLTDICPTSTSDSKWADIDGDGKDGFTSTTYVDGDEFVHTYICQRLILGHNDAPVSTSDSGKFAIKGDYFKIENDQSLFGDDSIVFPNSDPEVRFLADQYTNSYYYLVEMPSGSGCGDTNAALGL